MTGGVGQERVLRELRGDITQLLDRVGLLTRVFGRFKSAASIKEKIARKHYAIGGRLVQDLVGIRVASYFLDDLPIIRDLLVRRFGQPVDEVRDAPSQTTFQPIRWNIVFRLPETVRVETIHHVQGMPVDTTFEVQLRTVLAEGWHEVEHDLRYKRPSDWIEATDISRIFNGVLASLENADWTMLQLFDRLAYQKYKSAQWEPMFRMKYRIRLNGGLSNGIATALCDDSTLAKELFRARRSVVVRRLASGADDLPLTVSNFVFAANRVAVGSPVLIALEPKPIEPIMVALALREPGAEDPSEPEAEYL